MNFNALGKILVVLAVYSSIFGALMWFHRHSVRKFEYAFLSKSHLALVAVSVLMLTGGSMIFVRHLTHWAPTGWLLIGAGGAGLLRALILNLSGTNLAYGLLGTLLQLVVVVVFGTPALFAGFAFAGVVFVLLSVIVPVYVVNNRRAG